MATLDLSINGRIHQIACADGEEFHLRSLSKEIDERVRNLSASMGGSVIDNTLLLLTSLMLLDELHETRESNRHLKVQAENQARAFESAKQIEVESAVAAALEEVEVRISELTASLSAA